VVCELLKLLRRSHSLIALVEPGLEPGSGRLLVDPRVAEALGGGTASGGKPGMAALAGEVTKVLVSSAATGVAAKTEHLAKKLEESVQMLLDGAAAAMEASGRGFERADIRVAALLFVLRGMVDVVVDLSRGFVTKHESIRQGHGKRESIRQGHLTRVSGRTLTSPPL